jgi:CxxC motif-containing protein (DUF1111 family)
MKGATYAMSLFLVHRLQPGTCLTPVVVIVLVLNSLTSARSEDAPTGFDNQTNGFESQSDFEGFRKVFEEVEDNGDGLGPVYNSTSCVSCHQNPVTGGTSQMSVLRAGHHDPIKNEFIEPPGGSLIFQRAIDAAIQAHVPPGNEIRTLRMPTNVLGNGYLECIADSEIRRVQQSQPHGSQGAIVLVPVVVGSDGQGGFNFVDRVGRFGWKCQDASLLNFSAGAYINEMGVTSPLHPKENTSNGRDVAPFDKVADPEDKTEDPKQSKKFPFGTDVESFTRFMRSTKAPPRDLRVSDPETLKRGETLFTRVGCAVCHVADWTIVAKGTKIGDFTVPEALGNMTIHPYSDLMLHDVSTGDGIVQTQHAQRPARGSEKSLKHADIEPGENVYRVLDEAYAVDADHLRVLQTSLVDTANMIRTAPLWGLRTRPQLMHDGLSLTVSDAIRRHGNQAYPAKHAYNKLTQKKRDDLLMFLNSL